MKKINIAKLFFLIMMRPAFFVVKAVVALGVVTTAVGGR